MKDKKEGRITFMDENYTAIAYNCKPLHDYYFTTSIAPEDLTTKKEPTITEKDLDGYLFDQVFYAEDDREDSKFFSVFRLKKKKNVVYLVIGEYTGVIKDRSHQQGIIPRRKYIWPSREELLEAIKTKSFAALGREGDVSANAVRNWCKSYGIDPKEGKFSHKKRI